NRRRPGQHCKRRARSAAAVIKPEADRNRHRAEGGGGDEAEQDQRQAGKGRRTRRTSVRAAAGSASTIPAMITAQPPQPSAPSRSPASVYPKSAAQTGSSVKTSAVRVALVSRCAHVCTRNPIALANTPVTSNAPNTVQP